jgi:uncharacterized tellurite resistance protein B-like protein
MRFLRRLFGDTATPDESRETETVRRISAELDALPRRDAQLLAAFAYVLTRVALADRIISEEEAREMERVVQEFGGLPPERAELVMRLATLQASEKGGTENYLVTRQFRELATREERIGLVRCLFAVAAADHEISELENQQIFQAAAELGVTREEVVAIRQAYRNHLAVLRDLPRG